MENQSGQDWRHKTKVFSNLLTKKRLGEPRYRSSSFHSSIGNHTPYTFVLSNSFQFIEVLKKIQTWLDTKKSLTKMNKNTQHGDGVGVQMVKFNLILIEYIGEKHGRRNVKTTKEEGLENYKFVLNLEGKESLTR